MSGWRDYIKLDGFGTHRKAVEMSLDSIWDIPEGRALIITAQEKTGRPEYGNKILLSSEYDDGTPYDSAFAMPLVGLINIEPYWIERSGFEIVNSDGSYGGTRYNSMTEALIHEFCHMAYTNSSEDEELTVDYTDYFMLLYFGIEPQESYANGTVLNNPSDITQFVPEPVKLWNVEGGIINHVRRVREEASEYMFGKAFDSTESHEGALGRLDVPQLPSEISTGLARKHVKDIKDQ